MISMYFHVFAIDVRTLPPPSAQESTWQSVCLVLGVDSADMVTEAVAINRPFSRLDTSKCQVSSQSHL